MRSPKKPGNPEAPKDIARGIAEKDGLDRRKIHRESRRAVDAADRLLKEMDDFLKTHERKP